MLLRAQQLLLAVAAGEPIEADGSDEMLRARDERFEAMAAKLCAFPVESGDCVSFLRDLFEEADEEEMDEAAEA